MHINPASHSGLTLVEVLIVVILMGLMAVVAMPRFSMTTNVTLENKLDTHLSSLRRAIELYAIQHNGIFPGQVRHTDGLAVGTDQEAKDAFEAQLLQYSDSTGKTSIVKHPAFPFGPYFHQGIPINPLPLESNAITADFEETSNISHTGATRGTGWKIAVQTGQIITNNTLYDDR